MTEGFKTSEVKFSLRSLYLSKNHLKGQVYVAIYFMTDMQDVLFDFCSTKENIKKKLWTFSPSNLAMIFEVYHLFVTQLSNQQ